MKNQSVNLSRVLLVLFVIGTIVSLCIVIGNISNGVSFYFLMGYLLLAILLTIYIPIVTVLNSRSLTWVQIRGRLLKFITFFIVFGMTNYLFDYFFRPEKVDLLRELSISLGLAFGISFFDVAFLKKK